ncbi:MAG: TIGR00730 family Rossman fold protein [Verrucomicrobiota bacterium]
MKRIAVYCGASGGNEPAFAEAARELGAAMVVRGIGLVYGGGSVGLMGAIADAVLEAGGQVTGVIPRFLDEHELGHEGLTEMLVVDTMHERKQKMIDLADGFVAMPGGYGTLEELAEVLAWSQLGLHAGPCGLLNVAGFYDGLVQQLDHMVRTGLLRAEDRNRLSASSKAEALLERMVSWEAPATLKADLLTEVVRDKGR